MKRVPARAPAHRAMSTIAKCILIVVALLATAGYSAAEPRIAGYPSARWQFEPTVANAEIQFDAVDRRRPEEIQFRKLDQNEPRYAYGDDQFFPPPIRVVATHFADAFPRTFAGTQLVIDQLEVVDYVPRPLGDGHCSPDVTALYCAGLVLAGRALVPERNSVTCRLSGTYAGIAFSVAEEVHYDQPNSLEHRQAVTAVLLAATTKAIDEVRAEKRAASDAASNVVGSSTNRRIGVHGTPAWLLPAFR